MKESGRFWNRTAASYSRMPIADQASYEKKLEITRTYLRPDMDLLEIGCGTGSTAIEHAPQVKHIHEVLKAIHAIVAEAVGDEQSLAIEYRDKARWISLG